MSVSVHQWLHDSIQINEHQVNTLLKLPGRSNRFSRINLCILLKVPGRGERFNRINKFILLQGLGRGKRSSRINPFIRLRL